MLYTQFYIDIDRYVIATKDIVEIIPYVALKPVPQLPDYAAGLMNYHGKLVPVIDICLLLVDRSCQKKLSTRIIVVTGMGKKIESMTLGILAERATETVVIQDDSFRVPEMQNPDIPAIGSVAISQGNMVTKMSVADIFNKLDEKLFFPEQDSAITN